MFMNVTVALDALASLLWVVTVALIVLAIVRASRARPVKGLSISILATAITAVILTVVSAGLVFIQPEERGVVISAIAPKGYRENALQPGLRWIIPFFENVKVYPISRQTYTMSVSPNEGQVKGDDSITARTSDGQQVLIDSSVQYAVDPDKVVQVHIQWQDRYIDDVVRPLSRGAIRDVISQFGIEQVYSSKRDAVKQQITDQLSTKFEENGLVLVDFVLRNITFSPEYAASVEQKQIAQQQAEQAKFVVEQRKQEAEQARQVAQGSADAVVIKSKGDAQARLIQANAEAQALTLLSQSLKDNPALLNYTFINKMGPGVQTVFLPNNVPYLLPLPTANSSSVQAVPEQSPSILPTLLPTLPPALLPTPTPTATP
jgi:regulator of protease activity HflC (stomatin/prohibitin superfamily)